MTFRSDATEGVWSPTQNVAVQTEANVVAIFFFHQCGFYDPTHHIRGCQKIIWNFALKGRALSNYKQNFLVDQTRACVNCQPARVLMSGFSISCTCARGISIRMIVLGFKLLNATSQLCSVKNYIIIIIVGALYKSIIHSFIHYSFYYFMKSLLL